MIKNLTSFKRQIEIMSMFYPNVKIKDCKPYELADKYDVSEVTINRDLKDLRRRGIPINTIYGKGIEITGEINQKVVAELIVKYIAMYQSDIIIQNTLFKEINERDISQVFIFSNVNEAIDNKRKIVIQYKFSEQSIKGVCVLPCKIIHSHNHLQFIGVFNNTVGAFAFKDILSLTITNEKDLTNYDSKIIKFLESKTTNSSIRMLIKVHVENYHSLDEYEISRFKIKKIIGNNIIEAETNHYSLDDLAKWVVGQYGKVKVLEPKELRDRIVELAQATLNMYTDGSSVDEFRKNYGKEKESVNTRTRKISSAAKLKDLKKQIKALNKPEPPIALLMAVEAPDTIYNSFDIELPVENLIINTQKGPSIFKKLFNWKPK
ncbi:MAG: helix-turn-helix transcriptional regulator [Ignavibacteria bacterium]